MQLGERWCVPRDPQAAGRQGYVLLQLKPQFTALQPLLEHRCDRKGEGIRMSTLPQGYLPHQCEFGEVVDSIRQDTRRPIPYKSQEWTLLYLAYVAGRKDALKEEITAINPTGHAA